MTLCQTVNSHKQLSCAEPQPSVSRLKASLLHHRISGMFDKGRACSRRNCGGLELWGAHLHTAGWRQSPGRCVLWLCDLPSESQMIPVVSLMSCACVLDNLKTLNPYCGCSFCQEQGLIVKVKVLQTKRQVQSTGMQYLIIMGFE